MPCPGGVLAPCDLVPTGPCYWDGDGRPRNPHLLPLLTSISPSSGPALGGTRVLLSGTALARLFVALIETYQQSDGSILIPEPIQPYLRAERIPAN